jgi:hypothetical protein
VSCGRTQEFLAKAGIRASEVVDAKKNVMGESGALALLEGMERLYVAKGKKVVQVDLRGADLKDVVPLMLGPTGNLRAPALKRGKTLVIGFDEGLYREVFTL